MNTATITYAPEIRTAEFMDWLKASVNRYARPDVACGRIQEEDIDDILQDAYVHFMAKAGQYEPSKGSWNTWRNKVLRYFYFDQKDRLTRHFYDGRQSGADDETDVLANVMSSSRSDAAVRTEEYVAVIRMAFRSLTVSERKVAEMKFSGYDKLEIMDRLGMTGGSVDRHWCCAKGKIEKFIEDYYLA